jgi:hypothetical protein
LDDSKNAIPNALVVVMQGGENIKEDYTNSSGEISFLLPNGAYSIKATKSNYTTSTKSVNLLASYNDELVLSIQDVKVTRAVYLKTSSGDLTTGYGRVFYRCKTGSDTETKDTSYSNGSFNAELSSDCTEVEVISIENYSILNSTASFSGTGAVTVEKIETITGNASVTISIAESTQTIPSGLKVKLIPTDGTVPIETLTTGTNVVLFDSVVAKNYYVLVQDLLGNYQTYNGSILSDVKEVKQGETTQFNAILTKTPSLEVTVTIRDSSDGLPIKGAEVKLTSIENNEDYQTIITGATGQVAFNASEGKTFVIAVDHPEYLVGETTSVQAGDSLTISLVKADNTNSNTLLVRVSDLRKTPIENARVILKTLDVAQPVVGEKMTGTSGEVEFSGLIIGKTYMVVVSKENFGSVNSESVQIVPRIQKILEIPFDIAEKTISLEVVTPQGTPLSGVNVKAINYFSSEQIGTTQITGTEGTTQFNIRADKKIYFVAEYSGYTKYYSSAEYASSLTSKRIVMQTTTTQLKAAIIGIYSENESEVTSADGATLSEGTYIIKGIVQVPKGTYTEAGLHLRTGKETQNITNLVEEDGIFISEVKTSGRTIRGTTYTPPNGYDIDSKNIVSAGNAKWINSIWRNPSEGAYEVEAKIIVTETNPNAPINIYYRGWAKGSTVTRYPQGTLTGNELYALANVKFLSSGGTSLCEDSFCKTTTIQAITGNDAGKKKYVTGTIEAKKDVEYLLTIDLVNYSGKSITNAVLKAEGISIDVNSLTVNGNVVEESTANLGTIGVDSPLRIQLIFKATSSGASLIKIGINSLTQTELDLTYNINVNPNKKFTLEMTPKVIVPFMDNVLFFEAKDANTPLNGVIISLKSGTTILGNATTNGEGIAQYTLSSPRAGEEITITAKKEGYDELVVIKKADKGILTIIPIEIEETIKVGRIIALETEVILENDTSKTIKLVSAQVNGEVKNYFDIKFVDNINGTIIEPDGNKNYNLSIKLNSAGTRILEPKDLTGTIIINTEVSGENQSFLNEIPIKIRLTFPGMLDSGKCLKINPTTIDFITTDAEVTQTITITNNCTAEDTSVELRNIEAKLNEASKFGTISIVGAELNGQLTDKLTSIGDYIERNAETEVIIKYSPTTIVESGTQNLTLSLIGKNLLDDGTTEKVEAQTKLNITMNNLAKCIIIEEPSGGLILDTLQGNQGYGGILGSSYSPILNNSLNSYQGFNNTQYYNQMYMRGIGGRYAGINPYTSGGYLGAGYSNTGMLGAGATTSYNQSAFTITNNCTTDVEINLDVDPRIIVAENEFTISAGSDNVVMVQPGYVLGKYNIKVNARLDGTKDAKKKIDDVKVTVRRLGDIDRDCIKTNVTRINLNSFIMSPQKYSVYNYCYDVGVQLARANIASINCSAPTGAGIQALPYLQVGMEQYYQNQYQLGMSGYGQSAYGYNSYNQFSSNGGVCGIGSCSLITGTNIRQRDVTQSSNGSVERVDFDVIPNPNYIPQRRLFNNQTGTAGLFQNVGDIRQWATETDARTDVYGNLNINYTNAYGAQECMEFPITIADMWRVGESIDSALNWGDPLARPIDCQRKSSLDIIAYWTARNPTTTTIKGTNTTSSGVVPETEYTGSNKNIYIYIADPGALRIGPMPNTISQYYPQAINTSYNYTYFQQQAQQTTNSKTTQATSDDARANCGLTDSIKVITKLSSEQTGGAIVTVESTHSGSLFKNSYGPNLMVQVDRSAMTSNCVKLEVPIKATVTRAITMETQELTWNLRILFTKQGYTYKGLEGECMNASQIESLPTDCIEKLRNKLGSEGITKADDAKISDVVKKFLEENKLCAPYVNVDVEVVKQLLSTGTIIATGCNADLKEYGFDLISKVELESYNKNDIVDCTKYFCNDEMLQVFLLHRFSEVKQKVETLTNKHNAKSLIELYKASGTQKVKNCAEMDYNYYKSEEGTLATKMYNIPKELLEDSKVKSINELSTAALPDMIGVLNNIKDKEKILLEIDYNKDYDGQYADLGMTKVGNKTYMTLNGYIKLLEVLKENEANSGDCAKEGVNCEITYCGRKAKLNPTAFFNSIIKAKLVEGVIEKEHEDMNESDIEFIYSKNPKLNEIHKLAKFDSELKSSGVSESLLLTNINPLGESQNTTTILSKTTGLEGLGINFTNKTSTEIGRYSIELDYDLANTTKTVKAILGEKELIKEAPRAVDNIFLKTGFKFNSSTNENALMNTTRGVILETMNGAVRGLLYKRLPVRLNVSLNGTEKGLSYNPSASLFKPQELIKWYNSNGVEIGNDKYENQKYTINVKSTGTPQTIRGIYYYPQGGELGVYAGITGGLISAKEVGITNTEFITQTIPGQGQSGVALQSSTVGEEADRLTITKVLELLKSGKACIQTNAIVWNEKKLMEAN